MLLYGAAQWSRSVCAVESRFGKPILGGVCQCDCHIVFDQPRFHIAQHQLDDVPHLLRCERLENDGVVQPVQELGAESAAQRLFHGRMQARRFSLLAASHKSRCAAVCLRSAEVAGHDD